MENNKEDIIVVLAGYKDKMAAFYGFIPGMASRIGNHIEFPDYEDEELVEIGKVLRRREQAQLLSALVSAPLGSSRLLSAPLGSSQLLSAPLVSSRLLSDGG